MPAQPPRLTGASDEEIHAQHETWLRGQGTLSPRDRNEARAELSGFLKERSDARVQRIVEQEKQRGAFGQIASAGAAGLLNFANTATLNFLPQIVGAVPGASAQNVREGLAASRESSPIASVAGDVGGFLKAGPAAALTGGAGKAAVKGVRALTGRLPGLSQAAVERNLASRASQKFLENLAGGGAAITAFNAVEGTDPDRTFQQRLTSSYNDTFSIANLGLTTALSGVSAAVLRKPSAELQPLFERFRRLTGREIPADVATNSSALQDTFDLAAQVPGLKGAVQKSRDRLLGGLRDIVREVGDNAGARRGGSARAAASARRLTGVDRELKARGVAGAESEIGQITQRRRAPTSEAFQAEGERLLSIPEQRALRASLDDVVAKRPRLERKASSMESVLDDMRRETGRGPLSLNDLESVRRRLGEIAFAVVDPTDPAISALAKREARDLYNSVRSAMEQSSPRIAQELRAGERLRRMEESLGDVNVSAIDEQTLQSFWGASKQNNQLIQRWEGLEEFATPEDIGAMKGWLLDSLVTKASTADGTLSSVQLSKAFKSPGMFNRQVIDRVLPGVRSDLTATAKIVERAKKGVLKGRGSDTAARQIGATFLAGRIGGGGLGMAYLLTNPYSAIPAALGAAGTMFAVKKSMRSLVNGKIGDVVSRGAQGVAPSPLTSAAPALQQVTAQDAANSGRVAVETGVGAIQGAGNLIQRSIGRGPGQ